MYMYMCRIVNSLVTAFLRLQNYTRPQNYRITTNRLTRDAWRFWEGLTDPESSQLTMLEVPSDHTFNRLGLTNSRHISVLKDRFKYNHLVSLWMFEACLSVGGTMAAQPRLHQELILDINTDVAEFCTSPNSYNLLAVGTYELDESTRERHGRLHMYSLANSSTGSNSQPNLVLAATLDTPGIFDLQWTQLPSIHDKPCIGLALADGTLQLLTVAAAGATAAKATVDTAARVHAARDGTRHASHDEDDKFYDPESQISACEPMQHRVQLQKLHSCKAVSEGMALSLDWSNQQQQQQPAAPLVAVSSSSGAISVLQVQSGGVSQLCEWQGHELEVWMVHWDRHKANVLYSGADDCSFKGWDIRCPKAISTTSSTAAAAVQHPASSTPSTTHSSTSSSSPSSTAVEVQHPVSSTHSSTADKVQHPVSSTHSSTADEVQHPVSSTHSSTADEVQHPVSSTHSSTVNEVQGDLQPMTEVQHSALFSNRKAHGAGVCCISSHPRREHTLVTGSYDESIRLWDVRALGQPVETCQVPTGGGVWRLKWHPSNDSLLLAACMYNGFALVNVDDSWSSMQVVEQYMGHDSIAYGADWYRGSWPLQANSCSTGCGVGACDSAAQCSSTHTALSTAAAADVDTADALAGLGLSGQQPQQKAGLPGEGSRDIIATCSFYDRRLHLWSPTDSYASSN